VDLVTVAVIAVAVWLVTQAMGNGVSSSPAAPTGKLSPMDIAELAASAGFQGADLTVAVAIALAESGGDAGAYNPETAAGAPQGKGSYGLWQIYLYKHPEFAGENLLDPQANANAAFAVYSAAGNNFTPWTTFTHGTYMAHLDEASQYLSA
jgi:hypothetical protein